MYKAIEHKHKLVMKSSGASTGKELQAAKQSTNAELTLCKIQVLNTFINPRGNIA